MPGGPDHHSHRVFFARVGRGKCSTSTRITQPRTIGSWPRPAQRPRAASWGCSPAQAATHHLRHQLTQCLGGRVSNVPEPEVHYAALAAGDRLLLCSDGLTDMVADGALAEVLRQVRPPQETCQALVDLALAGGGRDNVTVIVARLESRGFLSRELGADRRVKGVRLTPLGRQMLAVGAPATKTAEDKLLRPIPQREHAAFLERLMLIAMDAG